jgi:TP901-1 family phage major tail protein
LQTDLPAEHLKEETGMAGQRGRDMLIEIGAGGDPPSFVTVAGIRTRSLTLGASQVDATTSDSPEAWRELMAAAGVKRLEVAGSGVFKDAASDGLLRAAFFAGEPVALQLTAPDFGVFSGSFQIVELVWGGEHDGEATFSVRLASAGVIAFEATP